MVFGSIVTIVGTSLSHANSSPMGIMFTQLLSFCLVVAHVGQAAAPWRVGVLEDHSAGWLLVVLHIRLVRHRVHPRGRVADLRGLVFGVDLEAIHHAEAVEYAP